MQRALALDNSPALGVALPFFLNVPLFTVLCGLLLYWQGPDLFVSHLSPGGLAATHLLVLGALASAMFGGLFQILPVATGIHPVAPRLTSALVYSLLVCGTFFLASAFLTRAPWLFGVALLALLPAMLGLLASLALGMWRHRMKRFKAAAEIVQSARLALAALAVTVVVGLLLAGNYADWWQAPAALRTQHPLWGLAGWLGLLVSGMSYQLIPVFQATELYPRWMTRFLGPMVMALLAVLLLVSQKAFPAAGQIAIAAEIMLALALGTFAVVTLHRLLTRKRPHPDITTAFWLSGMVCLLAALTLWMASLQGLVVPPLLTGSLVIVGFGLSVVNGMLYKIVPFLLWFNMQRRLDHAMSGLPKVKDMLPERWGWLHYMAHVATVACLPGACLGMQTSIIGAAASMVLSGALQGMNFGLAMNRYQLAGKRIRARIQQKKPFESAGIVT